MAQRPHSPPEGVRLLSHRPSVLAKLLPLAGGGRGADFDFAGEGLEVGGPGWRDALTRMLAILPAGEREELYAVWLEDELALPLPAAKILERARTAWFPAFLTRGRWIPYFQPVVELATLRTIGRQALLRGCVDAVELSDEQLRSGAEAHDSIHPFDRRSRLVALEVGLPAMEEGEALFVGFEPRAVIDVESSLSATWPAVARHGGSGAGVCLQLAADAAGDLGMLAAVIGAHRARGALIAVDGLTGTSDSLACLDALRPDFAILDPGLTSGMDASPVRRRLVAALVEAAHVQGATVIVTGVERPAERDAARSLGIDCGRGAILGLPVQLGDDVRAGGSTPIPG